MTQESSYWRILVNVVVNRERKRGREREREKTKINKRKIS